ncbi:hypothetical protein RM780_09720 [Streptomyces sp. DSM 44917]|uniref:Uncharacterized protein n=1 Tax=Streptomyces boetiae TaxID=3075541 RepID=A0ABU2L6P9_9ACTN|nr:hypothetical protein [Streptomyces sp. DSM 44917]MDT0307240.1 hypothetical protein [Streptomyces sp. DSM 44917]
MPFAVREDTLRIWLTELIVCRELQEAFADSGASLSAASPPIDMAWRPAKVGEEDTAVLLIRAAQAEGVLCGPHGEVLDAEFVDDGDLGYFRFFLHVASPVPLTLASPPCPVPRMADPAATGIEAGVATLLTAADHGRRLHYEFTAAITAAGGDR